MLGVLCARPPKPWVISPHTFSLHPHHHPPQQQLSNGVSGGPGPSIWRVIVPAAAGGGDWRRDYLRPVIHIQGDGSWNVACDARPARWLHRLDLTYLLFGVCLCLAPIDWNDVLVSDDGLSNAVSQSLSDALVDDLDTSSSSSTYRVTGRYPFSFPSLIYYFVRLLLSSTTFLFSLRSVKNKSKWSKCYFIFSEMFY